MAYFQTAVVKKKEKKYILARRYRKVLKGFREAYRILPGDILDINFRNKGLSYSFEGICISIKGKNLANPDSAIILRNVINSISIELTVSYYYIRLFSLKFADYKRKKFFYNRSKLFFLRQKLNKHSRVK